MISYADYCKLDPISKCMFLHPIAMICNEMRAQGWEWINPGEVANVHSGAIMGVEDAMTHVMANLANTWLMGMGPIDP